MTALSLMTLIRLDYARVWHDDGARVTPSCVHPLVCGTRASTFPRHDCPGLAQADDPPGRRAQGAPDAQRTRGSHTKENATGTPEHRRSLRNGLRLIARS